MASRMRPSSCPLARSQRLKLEVVLTRRIIGADRGRHHVYDTRLFINAPQTLWCACAAGPSSVWASGLLLRPLVRYFRRPYNAHPQNSARSHDACRRTSPLTGVFWSGWATPAMLWWFRDQTLAARGVVHGVTSRSDIAGGVLAEISGGDQDKVYLLSEREPYRRRIETPERKRSFRRKLAITFEIQARSATTIRASLRRRINPMRPSPGYDHRRSRRARQSGRRAASERIRDGPYPSWETAR